MPPSSPPPDINPYPSILPAIWVPFSLSLLLVLLRLYVRRVRHLTGTDDYLICASLLLYLATCIFATYNFLNGSTRHTLYLITTLSPAEFTSLSEGSIVVMVLGWVCAALSKTSVAAMFPRILQGGGEPGGGWRGGRRRGWWEYWRRHWRYWVLGVHVVVNALLVIVLIVVLFTKCVGVKGVQSGSTEAVLDGGRCTDGQERSLAMASAQAAFAAYLDFFLALFPLTFIYKLHTTLRHKLAIFSLLGLDIVAGSVSIVKTVYYAEWFRSTDPSWDSRPVYIWSFIELGLLVIAGSIPPCKPVWDWWWTGTPIDGSAGQRGGRTAGMSPRVGAGGGPGWRGRWCARRGVVVKRESRDQEVLVPKPKARVREERRGTNWGIGEGIMVHKKVEVESAPMYGVEMPRLEMARRVELGRPRVERDQNGYFRHLRTGPALPPKP